MTDPNILCLLESELGPDPINPCADLAGIGAVLHTRIRTLEAELAALRTTYDNIFRGIDDFAPYHQPPGW